MESKIVIIFISIWPD